MSRDKVSQFRSLTYKTGRVLGDVQAVRKGRVGKRVSRRIAGRYTGRGMGKVFNR